MGQAEVHHLHSHCPPWVGQVGQIDLMMVECGARGAHEGVLTNPVTATAALWVSARGGGRDVGAAHGGSGARGRLVAREQATVPKSRMPQCQSAPLVAFWIVTSDSTKCLRGIFAGVEVDQADVCRVVEHSPAGETSRRRVGGAKRLRAQ